MPGKTAPTAKKATPEVKKDTRTYFYAVGRRKTAVSQVRLIPKGKGDISVNGARAEEYFFGTLLQQVLLPLKMLGMTKSYDIIATVKGGGISGQADALRHGISRALALAEEGLKITLKRGGLLTRDSRSKERKKFGLKKARRSPQWSKR